MWVHREDFCIVVEKLLVEFMPHPPPPKSLGVRRVDGISAWVGRWRNAEGEVKEVRSRVNRFRIDRGAKVPLDGGEFEAKQNKAKDIMIAKMKLNGVDITQYEL